MDGDTPIGRRRLLVGAGVGLGGLALAGIPTAASAATERDNVKGEGRLTGSWLVDVTFGPSSNPAFPAPPPSTTVNSFAAGAVFAVIVLSPEGPFPALGTWQLTGDHTYKATSWESIAVPGGPTLAVRSSQHGTFSDEHIESVTTYDLFIAPDLMKSVATGSATSTGKRIPA